MFFRQELTGAARWIVPLAIFGVVLIGGLLVRVQLFRMLNRWAKNTQTRFDDLLLASIKRPSGLWILMLAMLLAAQTIHLPSLQAEVAMRKVLGALLVLSITLGAARLAGDLVAQRGTSHESGVGSTGLLRTFTSICVLIVGLMVMLATLGIKIAPLLGALGVGGLAAGLALQPTLSNLFAGFQIAVARQIRVGNRVRLSSGEEGYVTDISWRTTTLRTPNNNLTIIPNSKFADSIVTNFNLPDPFANVTITLRAPYESDVRLVEKVLREEAARATAELQKLVHSFEPVVRLQAFGDSALEYQVVFRVRQYDDQFDLWGELHTRLLEALRRADIPAAYPRRLVQLSGDMAAVPGSADHAPKDGAAKSPSKPA